MCVYILITFNQCYLGDAANENGISLRKHQLACIQKSYSEAFSMHALTRIIYSGWKERVLWLLLFLSAVIGLGYMSREIIKEFHDKDVRTEVRMEQLEKQTWPAITFCAHDKILQHTDCYKNVSVSGIGGDICSHNIRPLNVSDFWQNIDAHVEEMHGCIVLNRNGTLVHQGKLKRGLEITVTDPNDSKYSGSISVYFRDVHIASNSSHAFHLQETDYRGAALPPGYHDFLLETTVIEKLGSPFRSVCTKEQSIYDRHQSRYSYNACMDRCVAITTKEKCGDVLPLFQDYVAAAAENEAKNQSQIIECLRDHQNDYLKKSDFLKGCDCKQPCKQTLYKVSYTPREIWAPEIRNNKWVITIQFKINLVNMIKEYRLVSKEELISQIGGLGGLFLGMSLLSLIEVLFYAIISIIKGCV